MLQTVCNTIVQPDIDLPTENFTVDDDNLLEVAEFVPKESVEDVKYGGHLIESQHVEINSLISDFGDISTDKPGTTNLVEHHMELTTDDPIRSKPYPIPYSVRESLKGDISDMLKMGVIRESNSPYAAPVVIVRKKDGTNRVCVDYRNINKVTVDPEPMTNVTDLFSSLSEDKYFTKIDLSKGYWQVPVAKQDTSKTAFITPDGTFEFLRMPFGMVNSGATLGRGIRKMVRGMDNVDSYIDDILVHTKNCSVECEGLILLPENLNV